MENKIITIGNVRGFIDDNGIAMLNAKDVAVSLGFTQVKNNVQYVRWETVNGYLAEFGFFQQVGKDDFIPENMVYRLGFKARNEAAQVFQSKLADEVLPTLRRTSDYISNHDLMVQTYFGSVDTVHQQLVKGLLMNIEAQQNKINILEPNAAKVGA